MTRNEKQRRLANEATGFALDLQRGGNAFFGNEGVTLYANGGYGDIIGAMIKNAGFAPKNAGHLEDPNEVLALVLGVPKGNLPEELQKAVNHLVTVSDDTKRAYSRRVPRLVKALNEVAGILISVAVDGKTARRNSTKTFGFNF